MTTNSKVDTEVTGKIMTPEEFYRQAQTWANTVRSLSAANAQQFRKGKTNKHTYTKQTKWHRKGDTEPKLQDSVSYKIKQNSGVVDNIRYQFPRHGIFRAYGVGNGQPINGTSAQHIYVHRIPVNWIGKPIDESLNQLADVAAAFYGDTAININKYN